MSQAAPADPVEARPGLYAQLSGLDNRFWIVNVMEMFERLAYYGVRAVIAIYMVLAVELGGPEFSQIQKGTIFANWAAMQSVLPMFTGGFADRYGHKKTIVVAIILKIIGYVMMAMFQDYWLFMAGCLTLAAGTAIFKPGVQGTLAATLRTSNASVGWGIFYQLVNIGGFLGPVLAGVLRIMDWSLVFYSCAIIVSINFLWLPFYKDPTEEAEFGEGRELAQRESWADLSQSVSQTLAVRWGMAFAGVCLAWFLVQFIGAAAVFDPAALEGFEGKILTPGSYVALGIFGAVLSVGVLAMASTRAFRDHAWMGMVIVLVVSMGLHLTNISDGAEDILDACAPGSLLAGMDFVLGYLTPWMAFLGGGLLGYAPRKGELDQGRTDPISVLVVSVAGLFQHRVIFFCLVFSGFWFMFNQVFDLLPNVIDDWVDSSDLILSVGAAFSNPVLPTVVALVGGLLFGGVIVVGVLLPLRPDRRPPSEVPAPAYVVVAIAFTGALYYLMEGAFGSGAQFYSPAIAVVLAAFAYGLRLQAKPMAWAAGGFGALGTFFILQSTLTSSAPELIAMAERGEQIPPEWMINLNPALIVFTMIGFAYLSSFMRPLVSIILGMVIATVGSIVAGTSVVGWMCLAGILVFSVGEMLSSPKKMEYLASLAKKGQEGTFMGYANAPIAIGWISGSLFAGNRYEVSGDKVNLARKHMVDEMGMSADKVEGLAKTDVMPTLANQLDITVMEAQHLLFETYHPERIWIDIAIVGLVSIVGMIVYDRVLRRIDRRSDAA